MNKDAILGTAIAYRSEDGGFVVMSPLRPELKGVGLTIDDAKKAFRLNVLENYFAYLEQRTAPDSKRRGRPSSKTNYLEIHTQISPTAKKTIADIANLYNLSQGEVIELALNGYLTYNQATEVTRVKMPEQKSLLACT